MKDHISTIVVVLAFLIVGIRLYLRYKGKGMADTGKSMTKSDTGFSRQEEEYEPYKNKKS